MTYYCAPCYNEERASNFDTIQNVYEHWLLEHNSAEENSVAIFRFYAVEMMSCKCGNFFGDYPAVIEHHATAHKKNQFVVVSLYDPCKCALCSFSRRDLNEHFKKDHALLMRTKIISPTRLTDECLNELLSFNYNMQFQCNGCCQVFNTEQEVRDHISRTHTGLGVQFTCNSNKNGDMIKSYFVECCKIEVAPKLYLKHLESHLRQYKCPKCNFQSEFMPNISEHVKLEHPKLHFDDIDEINQMLQIDYLSTKVIFGNGLVVTKQNLIGTKYSDWNKFESFLNNFSKMKKERFDEGK